jgi:reversibly glycosylated polypeptide/UDP-arabinopyranose mutase
MSVSVVIASNRPESLNRWMEAWKDDLKDTEVIIVLDTKTRSDFNLNSPLAYNDIRVYAWDQIDADLGDKAWIIPRRSSAIKSYGFLKATGDSIWTLDDDCFPEPFWRGSYPQQVTRILSNSVPEHDSWWNTINHTGFYPRGYPYDIRKPKPVGIFHGLWSGIPDLDGKTALKYPDFYTAEAVSLDVVPYGKLFPMCGMNLAFRRELLPVMYFGLQGHAYTPDMTALQKLPFDRFDDIWAGVFAKLVCDHLGYAVRSGSPSITHTKESDPQERVTKEAPGIEVHERFWKHIKDWGLGSSGDAADCYRTLSYAVNDFGCTEDSNRQYWYFLANAMRVWSTLTS